MNIENLFHQIEMVLNEVEICRVYKEDALTQIIVLILNYYLYEEKYGQNSGD